MADTALSDSEIEEFYDSIEDVETYVKKIAEMLKASKHAVVYTGAGVSTSAGISDFRGPNGVWTLEAKGLDYNPKEHVEMPTVAHMVIKALIDHDLVKYLVSQNVDGLHIKSGVPYEKIAELHGNMYKEYCPKCKKVYYRDFDTENINDDDDHRTGRMCDNCGTELWDSIINFSEDLPEEEFRNAKRESRKSDLAIVLGTSMRVTPACNLPLMRKAAGKLVIVNLQKTPHDHEAAVVIHAKTDQVMTLLMKELAMDIPEHTHQVQFSISFDQKTKNIKITEPTVDLFKFLNSLTVIDAKSKQYKMLPGRKLQVKMPKYENGSEISLKLDFNLLNRFTTDIKVTAECRVVLHINTFNATFSYLTF